jgi:YHS domain-containing protein
MGEADGFVAILNQDGTAGVWIEGEDCHLPCDNAGEPCHHCATAASGILVTVKNTAGAGLGDRVTVRLPPGAVWINLATIVGIPLGAAALGFLCLSLLGLDLARNQGLAVVVTIVVLGVGLVFSKVVYRRYGAGNQPYISGVQSRAPRETSTAQTVDPVCREKVDPATARGSIGYQGEMYYFAHHECLQAFLKDPVRYV